MGLRGSKHKTKSYDVAPVVSNKDFSYKRQPKSFPKVELAQGQPEVVEEIEESSVITKQEDQALTGTETVQTEVPQPKIPQWVNEANFKKLLLKTHPNIVDIMNFKAFPALAAGENYGGLMLKVQMSATFENNSTKDFFFMLKVAYESKEIEEYLQAMNSFKTETTVYNEVIPELEDMYQQAGVEISFGPKSYRLELEDDSISYILMEDLNVDGFRNADRLECLNLEHTLSVLRKLAKFHAASACRVSKKGSYPAIFSPDMDNENARNMMEQMFMPFKKPFLNNLKTYHNGEKYYSSMEKFFSNLVELFVRSHTITPHYFCALNHGDLWSNNILFKYSPDGRLVDNLFVDFQHSNWGSPALDLYYFIISSVQTDIKLSQFDYFISYYYEHLSEQLKVLEYSSEIPTLEEFQMQVIDFGSMATMASFFTLGVVLLDPAHNANLELFLGDSEASNNFRNIMYSNERYRQYINEILPWLYNRGFMDINLT